MTWGKYWYLTVFLKLWSSFSVSDEKPSLITAYSDPHQLCHTVQSLPKQRQYSLLNLPMYHCRRFSANSLAGSEAWRSTPFSQLQLGGAEEWSVSTWTSLSPSFSPPLLAISLLLFSSLSLICFLLAVSTSLRFLVFFSADAHFSLRWPVFLSHSHSNPLPPSLSRSFALCLRVCRWLLLAGSVTRGNWGRVHFNRTNGNKLIHFHCCLCDDVWAAGKKKKKKGEGI